MKRKIIFGFIFEVILLGISIVLLLFFCESNLVKIISPKLTGYFDYHNYNQYLVEPLKSALNNKNYYSLIILVIPFLNALTIIILLLFSIIRKKLFPLISIILILVVTALFYFITSVSYYVLFNLNKFDEIKTIITFKNIQSGDEDLVIKIINVAFLIGFLLFTAISTLYYLNFIFTCLGESFKRKKTKKEKFIEYCIKNNKYNELITANNQCNGHNYSKQNKLYIGVKPNRTKIVVHPSNYSTSNSDSTIVQKINSNNTSTNVKK